MKTNQDFYIDEGDPKSLTVPLTNPDGSAYLAPGGATADWWAAPSRFDDPTTAPIKHAVSIATVNGQSVVTVPVLPGDTQGRGGKRFYHECRVLTSGVPLRMFSGTMTVRKTLIV
jgi:hypothetical protein